MENDNRNTNTNLLLPLLCFFCFCATEKTKNAAVLAFEARLICGRCTDTSQRWRE
jgi:hypothetical protein